MNELGLVDAGSDPVVKITLSAKDIAELSESIRKINE
jgi:hypothetical protein